jgi:hypothetical protein
METADASWGDWIAAWPGSIRISGDLIGSNFKKSSAGLRGASIGILEIAEANERRLREENRLDFM